MTVDVKMKVYAVVTHEQNGVDVALFQNKEAAIREIEALTNKKYENWDFDDAAVDDDSDTAYFLQECEIN